MAERPDLGEFELIKRYLAPLAQDAPLAFGLTDDAAVIRPRPDEDIVVTKDALVAGVHFLPDDPPDLVAKKLLRVSLSDLAAMGATPYGYLIAAALPRPLDEAWVAGFTAGLADDQKTYGVSLIGGDTVSTDGPLTLSLTAFGGVPTGQALRRNGAKAGDDLYVSGTIGDGALGLEVAQGRLALAAEAAAALLQRYRCPEPRVVLGPRLLGLATAAIDVSDGLAADLGHICETSGCGATVHVDTVPLSPAARAALVAAPRLMDNILTGGDDYELLFAVSPGYRERIADLSAQTGVPLTRIGVFSAGKEPSFVDGAGKPLSLTRSGFRHF